jgi:predicted transcriptional regulator YdeE
MTPKIVEHEAFTVVGIAAPFDASDKDFFHKMWMERLPPFEERLKPYSPDQAYYGVYVYGQGSATQLPSGYMAGMRVEGLAEVSEGLEALDVAGGRYVVEETTLEKMGPTSDYLFGEWLPASGCEYDHSRADFEYYPPDTEAADSPVLMYLPVQ